MLTDKELVFCDVYVKTLNYSKALRDAGYTNKNQSEAKRKLLSKQEINDYIAYKLREKTDNVANEDDVWQTLTRLIDTKTTVSKIFVVDKTLVEKQVPVDTQSVLKACDMLAKLLGMYDKKDVDDNVELPD